MDLRPNALYGITIRNNKNIGEKERERRKKRAERKNLERLDASERHSMRYCINVSGKKIDRHEWI